MRIIQTTPSRVGRPAASQPGATRAANVEMLGLLATTVVVLFGVGLAIAGRHGLKPVASIPKEQSVVVAPAVLHDLASPAALVPLLTMFESDRERMAVAERLYRRATDTIDPLEHVGGLAGVTVTADERKADSRLVQARARAAARETTGPIRLLSPADLAALKPSLAVRTSSAYLRQLAGAIALFVAAFWIAHVVRRWRGATDDPIVLPTLLLLCGIGLMGMIALRDPLRDAMIASTFASGVAAGLALLLVASELDYESSPLRHTVLLPLAAALLLAVLLLLFGSGPGTSGVKVNLFGGQPVEAIRLLVVFAIAGALARRFELLRELHEAPAAQPAWLRAVRLPRWRDVRPVVASMLLVMAFFFLQKDLGPALVLSGVVIALYAIARGRLAFVFVGTAMLAAGFAAAYAIDVPATVGQRVRIWADPWNNGVTGGNQIAHGLWALATGGLWGSGPGAGSPQSIPEGHTDFVLAALGEQFGAVGVLAVVALFALLAWRCLRIAVRAPGDYSALLGVGLTLALVVQAAVIASGLLGLLPLTGVVTPFLSYGRSSMLANCVAVGIILAVARRRGDVRAHLAQPVRVLGVVLAVVGGVLALRVTWVQVVKADAIAGASSLSGQADGGYRFEYNPRLVAAARAIERGTIYDRRGAVLATSRPSEMRAAGESPGRSRACTDGAPRCYPLGALTFGVIGDWASQANWGARNASYVEREYDTTLKGFDDGQRVVEVVHPRTGARERTVRRDYSALLPLVRHGADSTRSDVALLLGRPRDVHVALDARLQQRTAHALASAIERGGHARGAAVVLDVETGDVLASVSYPMPDASANGLVRVTPSDASTDGARAADALLDRVRYGLYPPGSTFKLLVAAAALRSRPEVQTVPHLCVRLPDGRVGHEIRGWSRPVRDDVMDTVPHGAVDLHKGLVVSCNAYFAQLAMQLGPRPILDAVSTFQIDVARPATAERLRDTLPHAGYGQGEVLVSPLKMARVVASIAGGGLALPARWTLEDDVAPGDAPRFLAESDAARLARDMREVVKVGTGKTLAGNATPIAGKTGTAEVDGRPAHSWFVGFAPYGGSRPIAFAVIVEHAGYGARAAAPVAGAIVDAARDLGYFEKGPETLRSR
ncbi:MAG: FtsW/RodA/SpoVE family cell cycle protein [Acidobacteria bacterium]|nr:FtsW/RodA/SpoVE family cell cycle protein [Acidobacteriota bacterium]